MAAAQGRPPAGRRRPRRGELRALSCARRAPTGSILLVGREPDPPYDRPPLSKGYLRGEESREDALFRPDEWWEEQDIELLTRTSVMKLDAGERVATLSNKEESSSARRCWRPGANVRRLRVDGCDLEGIHYLRAFGNADAIRADAEEAERVVMIGGSYIGTEVAASLTAARASKCAIVMLEDVTLERSLRRARSAASSRACSRSTGSRSTAATSSSASRATDGRVTEGGDQGRAASSTATSSSSARA